MAEKFILAYCVLFLFCTFSYSESSTIENVNDDVVGEYRKDFTFKWRFSDFQEGANIFFYKGSIIKKNIIGFFVAVFKLKTENIIQTADRFSGNCTFPNGNGTCQLTLSNLNYDDEDVYFAVDSNRGAILVQRNVTLMVKGGPEQCGNEILPQNFTCSENALINGNITLCGKPKPNVTWYIGDDIIQDVTSEEATQKHQYRYSFKLKTTSDMCGRTVLYRATGFKNEVTGSATILKRESQEQDESSLLSTGAIVGIVLGSISIFIAIIVLIIFLYYKSKVSKQKESTGETDDIHMTNGNV